MLNRMLKGHIDIPYVPIYGYRIDEYNRENDSIISHSMDLIDETIMKKKYYIDLKFIINDKSFRLSNLEYYRDYLCVSCWCSNNHEPEYLIYTDIEFRFRSDGKLAAYYYAHTNIMLIYGDDVVYQIIPKKACVLIYYISKVDDSSKNLAAYWYRKRPEIEYITLNVYRNLSKYGIPMEAARQKLHEYLKLLHQKINKHDPLLADRNLSILILSYV